EIAGQMLVELWRADGARRIRVDDLVAMEIAIEAPHCRERPRHRSFAEPALRELREKSAHREPIDALPAPGTAALVAREESGELGEIRVVRAGGVRRHVAFFGEMPEVLRDVIGGIRHAEVSLRSG